MCDWCVTVVRSWTGVLLLSGHGLVCHRAIRTICEMMGIQDLHSKVEGSSRNVKAITKGFFNSLIHQVGPYTHQRIYAMLGGLQRKKIQKSYITMEVGGESRSH